MADLGGTVVTQNGPVPLGPLRRVPVQGRSLARVQRMLDACAELIDQVGYEGLSTTLLAERASVAIGSVYQFFPDKRAIVQALTMRNVEAYVERLSARITDGRVDKWWDAVDAAMDEYVDMHRTMPGFKTLHFGDVVDTNLLDEERDNNAVIVEQLSNILITKFNVTHGPKLTFALSMAVEIADALCKAAFRYQPDGDERILAEAKDIVREYLYRKLS